MFGESESESPRTGSPWDGFLSKSVPISPVIEASKSPRIIPKLVPEVEEGNVEYKLRLLDPSEERFTRLVTQLNWRLHEGGGQAYYELGVADSGQLVGLTRDHLSRSLQTLDEMAGEIGASVIVVKEIELPAVLLEASRQDSPLGKIAGGAMRMRKIRVADYVESPGSMGDTESELISQVEHRIIADVNKENNGINQCIDGKASSPAFSAPLQMNRLNIPSPRLGTSDSDPDPYDSDTSGIFICDLEITSVHKQRPHRRRTPARNSPVQGNQVSSNFDLELSLLHVHSAPVDVPAKSVRKSEKWRRKELKRTSKFQMPRPVTRNSDYGDCESAVVVETEVTHSHPTALDDLANAATFLSLTDIQSPTSVSPIESSSDPSSYNSPSLDNHGTDTMLYGDLMPEDSNEKRFIVEALVVRKMSVEETFLDFVNI